MSDYTELVKRLRNHAIVADSGYEIGESFYADVMQAADAIEELSSQLDSMNEANIALYGALPKWIRVEERLPDMMSVVLITDGIDVDTGWIYGECSDDTPIWATPFADMDGTDVVAWMPLPDPPKEETE